MLKISGFFKSFYILIPLLIVVIFGMIIFNTPYYYGFEGGLNYLSPDLSENRTIIRESINLKRSSTIRIVFEKKNNYTEYDKDEFIEFINDLHLEIWNENEYFVFTEVNLDFFDNSQERVVITIGELKEGGNYSLYLRSNTAVNPTYHIGIGIGLKTRIKRIGHNIRNFY